MPFQPPAASSIAGGVDQLYYLLTGITVFFSVLIFSIIFYFMVKYRRRSEDEVPPETHTSMALELTWTIIPSLICVVLFVWASALYVRNRRPPASSTEIFVIGKQWMWHLQHPEGPREINELHVPVGVPVKLTHDFAGRDPRFLRSGVPRQERRLPGRYTSLWFEPTEIGTYHLFCAQYCGTNHARNDRLGLCDVAEGLCGLACRRREDRVDGAAGRAAFHPVRLHRLPRGRTAPAAGHRSWDYMASPKSLRAARRALWTKPLSARRFSCPIPSTCRVTSRSCRRIKGQLTEEQILAADRLREVARLARKERQMSTAIADIHQDPVESNVNYLNASYGIKSWLFTVDHKRIGLLYLAVDHLHVLRRRHRGHADAPATSSSRRARSSNRKPTTSCFRRTGSSWCFSSWCRRFRRRSGIF